MTDVDAEIDAGSADDIRRRVDFQLHGGESAAEWRARNRYPVAESGGCVCPTCLRSETYCVNGQCVVELPAGTYTELTFADGVIVTLAVPVTLSVRGQIVLQAVVEEPCG